MKSLIPGACLVLLAVSTASADPFMIQAPLTPAPVHHAVAIPRRVEMAAPAAVCPTPCATCPTAMPTTFAPEVTTYSPVQTQIVPQTTIVAEPQVIPQTQVVPQATVIPTTAYMPVATAPAAAPAVKPKVLYVEGQPIRNWWRSLGTGTRTTVATPVVSPAVVTASPAPLYAPATTYAPTTIYVE